MTIFKGSPGIDFPIVRINRHPRLSRGKASMFAVVHGDYELLFEDSEEVFAYKRSLGKEKLLVVCSFVDKETAFTLPEAFTGGNCLISNYENPGKEGVLRPYEAFAVFAPAWPAPEAGKGLLTPGRTQASAVFQTGRLPHPAG